MSRVSFFTSDRTKVSFGKKSKKKEITGTPYLFAKGSKIDLPHSMDHGQIFKHHGKTYVAMMYRGVDSMGRRVDTAYGQPVTLT